jgi:tRNA(fMet)-specific endonuclease VapC
MSRYCLDTSAYSHFGRGHAAVIETLDAAVWVGVPAIVLGELHLGFLQSRRRAQNLEELQAFLDNPSVTQLAIDAEVAEIFGELCFTLRAAGTPLPSNDVWIAATAIRHGATVLTLDHHFAKITRVGALILTV